MRKKVLSLILLWAALLALALIYTDRDEYTLSLIHIWDRDIRRGAAEYRISRARRNSRTAT